jgi:class 3 adenylate cyclase
VAVEVEGVRVGTVCVYGTEAVSDAALASREAVMRRYGALLSGQLAEVRRLRDENASIQAELRGVGDASSEASVHRSREAAAAWRETAAILGDVERAVGAAGGGDGAGVVACVVELRADRRTLGIVATSDAGLARHGMRVCLLRPVGDDDPFVHWRGAIGDASRAHHEDGLVTAAASARLGTPPGAYASVTAVALPRLTESADDLRALVVLSARAASTDGERAAKCALVQHFARIVAEAHRAALAVFLAPPPAAAPTEDAPDEETLEKVRGAFGSMKLRSLFALAEERGVPGVEDADGAEALLLLLAKHASTLARERRAHLQTLSVRELLAIGAAGGHDKVEAAESKRDMIAAILEAEGIFASAAQAKPVPLAPLPVPLRATRQLTAEQARVAFDPGAAWLSQALEREHETLTLRPPDGFPRAPVPPNEAARIATIERLGIADMRDWSAEDLAPFDGIAAAAAAVAGAPKSTVTLITGMEQVLIGMMPREIITSLLLGSGSTNPRCTSLCQYGVAKGAALAVADTAAPEAGAIAQLVAKDQELKAGFGVNPRAYLGVPMVADGVVLGNVCVLDDRPRPDFASDRRILEQLEALAEAAVSLFELRRLRSENATLQARRSLNVAALEPMRRTGGAPTERVALLMTDIEGSTALHERDPSLMKQALDVHDGVMRRAIADNGGIELTTEGDAFIVAFHTAADAIRCCFDAQLRLLAASWPAGLEHLGPAVRRDESAPFIGCRVRMAVHFAEAGGGLLGARTFEVSRHEVTRRPQYRGRVVDVCKFLSEMPSGGQVLVSEQAFDEVSLALTAALGDPRVIDLGRYEHASLGDVGHAYQILPRALASRRFDPPVHLKSGGKLTAPGYIHAPRTSPLVIVFVFAVGLSELRQRSDAANARGLEAFAAAVRGALDAHGGYEMKENDGTFMCAFSDARSALAFGAEVHARLAATTGKVLRCRVGVHGGEVTIEPHPSTGRMDAFGPACNRAARLAKAANPGQTIVDAGTAASAEGSKHPLYDLGEHGFKGIDETFRVVQVGEGFFPPIRSMSFPSELMSFDYAPENHLERARTGLALLDRFGIESIPMAAGRALDRAELSAAVTDALAAREAQRVSRRL